MTFLRRARASVVIANTWAIGWMTVGTLIGLWQILRRSIMLDLSMWRREMLGPVLVLAVGWALVGAVNGLFFSLILTSLGRRVRERLGILTVATFGALAGVVLPLVFGGLLLRARLQADEWLPIKQVVAIALIGAGLGAISAIATFGMARAPLSSRELTLDSGAHGE